MANQFSKEEQVAFEDIVEGFNDALVLSKNVNVYSSNGTTMERSNDTIWRPQPYIAQSFDGSDQTTNFKESTQLSVPANIGYRKSVPWIMNEYELRDALQEQRLGDSAKQKLASDINRAVMDVASMQGTVVVARTGSATGYDDLAECDTVFNELGVQNYDRCAALSSRDYNGMAGDLAKRQTINSKVSKAYQKSSVGEVASFDTYKLDYSRKLAAATATGVTVSGANQRHVPKATTTATTGETSNYDNRTQVIVVSDASNVKAGDCFTIAGVNSVHHITKEDTMEVKTFRVIGKTGNNLTISPAIVDGSHGSATDAEKQYQNVTATPANGAAITFINTQDARINPFWQKDAIEIIPSLLAIPTDAGAAIMKATTDNGVQITLQKFYDINTSKTKFRLDTHFGVANLQPEMSGILLFGQS